MLIFFNEIKNFQNESIPLVVQWICSFISCPPLAIFIILKMNLSFYKVYQYRQYVVFHQ